VGRQLGAGVFVNPASVRQGRTPDRGKVKTAANRSPAPQRGTDKTPRRTTMPRKPGLNSEFVMFDVVYEDGTQRSNRKVPRTLTGGIDGDKPAHEFLIEQDRDIAEKSGRPPAKIKSITRSGEKKKAKHYA
jgi:hypothetical protein